MAVFAAEIRPVAPADLPALLNLIVAHARFEQAPHPDATLARLEAALFAPAPRVWIWLLCLNGQSVGYASAALEFSTWRARPYFHLDCLYLQPHVRGLGWGKRLFDQIATAARAAGCDELQWQTPAWNSAAVGFYTHLGATSTSKLRFRLPL